MIVHLCVLLYRRRVIDGSPKNKGSRTLALGRSEMVLSGDTVTTTCKIQDGHAVSEVLPEAFDSSSLNISKRLAVNPVPQTTAPCACT